jgi:hypothetical protein
MPVRGGGLFYKERGGSEVPGSSRGGRGRKNNVRKNDGKKMYKQYRQKNDSTISVTTEEKENKNHTSKTEEFIMEKE